ncbi:hypothetical protein CEXT_586151 [Caerostris extrusa]|uniref:Uncharacterized protein n=1 Tax=Caerostris extrusa TaxID=172846 RepID=A0AAV4QNS9_CAEEX|nr:hypothetical protein CEXT_586151 [Caerostris extrusa]
MNYLSSLIKDLGDLCAGEMSFTMCHGRSLFPRNPTLGWRCLAQELLLLSIISAPILNAPERLAKVSYRFGNALAI